MRKLILAIGLTLALAAAGIAAADGPVIWKHHCPRWHEVQTVEDADGDGVHILCVRMAETKGTR